MQDAEAQVAARKVDEPEAKKVPVGFLSSNKDSWLQLFLNKYLFSVVYSLPGKIIIICIVIAGVILGAVGIVRPPPLKDPCACFVVVGKWLGLGPQC